MKKPNGYGGIVKYGGNRRKPWAVRTSYLEEQEDGTVKRKKKIHAWFATQQAALTYLAEMNNGSIVPEHLKYAQVPTFAEMYELWKKYRNGLKNKLSPQTWRNYDIGFNLYAPVHDKKIINIRPQDLQDCLNAQNHKSAATIGSMRGIVKGMWSYAVANEYTDKDITLNLVYEHTDATSPKHTRYTDEEIKALWAHFEDINNVDILLIYIYTGLRPSELLNIKVEDVYLDDRYMVGGSKTEAGIDRIIPIHEAILPLIRARVERGNPYLISNKFGKPYNLKNYHMSNFNTCMSKLGFSHTPHDGRYTFAALADQVEMNTTCKKLIMGHAQPNRSGTAWKTGSKADVTQGTYTEKTLPQLLEAVNLLPTF